MKFDSISLKSKESFLFPAMIKRLTWGIITVFLAFLPFQVLIWKRLKLPAQFLWGDEILIVFAFALFSFGLLCFGKIKKDAGQILFSLVLIGIIGAASGTINGNSHIVTANGVFDYIKNFLVIPVLCFFTFPKKRVTALYNILHNLALLICVGAVIQAILFLAGFPLEKLGIQIVDVRFGLPRSSLFMQHPNVIGLYALLFFILDFSLHRRVRRQGMVLILGILLSASRIVWSAFFISLFFLLSHINSKKIFVLLIPAALTMILALPFFYAHSIKEWNIEDQNFYRGYTLAKSIEIWKDHPVLGVGPGMYGGVVSMTFNSPIYKKYNFSQRWFDYGLRTFRSLDQFWPQVLAEMGFLGSLGFGFLLIALWQTAKKASLHAKDTLRKKMLSGFSSIPLILAVYLLGSGLNVTSFLLTYAALFGMVLGMKDEDPVS